MKTIPTALQSHFDGGTTTLCHCWRLTLRSGEKMGFTDHDETVVFETTNFEAQAGFTASEIQSSIGLNIDNLEASGALQSTKLDAARLAAGDFDHAAIEIWQVNWADASQRILQRKGHLGEVSYGQGHFNAEVRGLAHVMNQPRGRLFHFGCDATLGEARCGVNLTAPALQATAIVTAVEAAAVSVSGLQGFTDEWFTRGTLQLGARRLDIKRHRKFTTTSRLDFWFSPKFSISIGDSLVAQAGCDKLFSTCQAKFANTLNFQGFPHMPGSDFVLSVATSSPANDGKRRG